MELQDFLRQLSESRTVKEPPVPEDKIQKPTVKADESNVKSEDATPKDSFDDGLPEQLTLGF